MTRHYLSTFVNLIKTQKQPIFTSSHGFQGRGSSGKKALLEVHKFIIWFAALFPLRVKMPKLRIDGGQYELIVNLTLTVSLVNLLFIDFKNGHVLPYAIVIIIKSTRRKAGLCPSVYF